MAGVMSGHVGVSGGTGSGGNGSSGFTGTDTHRTLYNSDAHSTTTTNTTNSEANYNNNKLSMAAKIARWAPGHLSNYYESKERGSSVIGNDGNDGNGGAGGNNSTNVGSVIRGGDGGGSSNSIVPQRSRSSLRRQFLQANQSYMQGASAAGAVNDTTSIRSGGSVSSNAPFATYSTFE